MIVLNSLTVGSFSLNFLRVSWTIEDTDEDLSKFRFKVVRSGSPEGDFDTIRENLVNEFEIFDRTVNLHSKWRKFFYKVIAEDVTTGETAEIGPETVEEPRGADFVLLEIRRRNEEILLPRFVGTRVAFFVAKTFGQRCQECWDTIKQRQRSSRCLTCFNVGFVGGYFKQINGWLNMTPPDDVARVEEIGETHPSQTTVWTGHFPTLSPRDVIVEQTNKRWRVVDANFTEKRRVTGHQVIRLVEINKGDIEQELPVGDIVIPSDVFLGFFPEEGSGLL